MFYLVQENTFRESHYQTLIDNLERWQHYIMKKETNTVGWMKSNTMEKLIIISTGHLNRKKPQLQ